MHRIAVLITCFNRREKTLQCLRLISSQKTIPNIETNVFIVDGGSSDGTPEAIQKAFPKVKVKVEEGLYWAGGMREAWKMAADEGDYDYYLLLNDDTAIYDTCIEKLIESAEACCEKFGRYGIVIGSTCSQASPQLTYGGRKLTSRSRSKSEMIDPLKGDLQSCELGNGNIMFVHQSVYNEIGGLSDKYTHGIADYDYTLRASDTGIPVVVAQGYFGECERDHGNNWMSAKSSLKRRIDYLYSPKGLAYHEYLGYIKTFFPKEYFSSKIKLWAKTLFPFIWDISKK